MEMRVRFLYFPIISTGNDGEVEESDPHLHGKCRIKLREDEFEEFYKESSNKIMEALGEYLEHGSGWVINRVTNLDLHIGKYNPVRGSSYIETPKSIVGRHAVINIQNEDQKCFLWSVLAAKHYDELTHNQQRKGERFSNYKQCEDSLDLSGILITA